MARIRLIHWNAPEARERVEVLESGANDVEFGPFVRGTIAALRESPPDAIVIDLGRIPSQGRDIAITLRKNKGTRFIPIIFAGGDPEKIPRIRNLLPDATYATWENIHGALREAMGRPPADPVVPDSTFQAYAATPLARKLGIKAGSTVLLINAPGGFERTLEGLLEGVELTRQPKIKCDLVIWFTRSRRELEEGVVRVGELAGRGGLWIAWPKKASDVETDLTQNVVREVGLASGLVDYKVSSFDEIWSGLRFARRRNR